MRRPRPLQVLINASIDIDKEYYFAVLMDRACNGPVLVASSQGGMDIEEVAEKDPSAVLKVPPSCPRATS